MAQSGKILFDGTISAGTSLTPIIPPDNGGVTEVGISNLITRVDIVIGIGGTLPISPGAVYLYERLTPLDVTWKSVRAFLTPSLVSNTVVHTVYLGREAYQYKLSYSGASDQPYTLSIIQGVWNP